MMAHIKLQCVFLSSDSRAHRCHIEPSIIEYSIKIKRGMWPFGPFYHTAPERYINCEIEENSSLP